MKYTGVVSISSVQYTEGHVMGFACVACCAPNTVCHYTTGKHTTSVHVRKCSYSHKYTDAITDKQTETLQGMHRSASHKPYHDVRSQLCAQSMLFSQHCPLAM